MVHVIEKKENTLADKLKDGAVVIVEKDPVLNLMKPKKEENEEDGTQNT